MTQASRREPWVSGLPGGSSAPPLVNPHGAAILAKLSAFAAAEVAALAPHASDHFDGAERIVADPEVVEAKENFELFVALIDAIGADQALMIPIAAALAHGGRRR